MNDVVTFLDGVFTLSSEGLFGEIFNFLADSGKWAGAVADLLGLVK